MAKKKTEKIDALIFIDTNILLDFYRFRKTDISLKYLSEIESHKEKIILTSQVEMEFKKNRQNVILETINEVEKLNKINFNIPTILSDTKIVEMINKSKKEIENQQKKLYQKIERIFKNPSINDSVYKSLQRLFNHKSEISLHKDNNRRHSIRKLALKRFILGYPPRKKNDNSIGDAINWEWLIYVSQKTGKHIIIVSRDSDYGASYKGETYLNEWLCKEFKERVNRKRKIILTDKLSDAFKLVEIPVTKEMIQEEESLISESYFDDYFNTIPSVFKTFQEKAIGNQEIYKKLGEHMKFSPLQDSLFEFIQNFNRLNNKNE